MRIRTIKPEFWVSENVGKLSRDARLLFIGLWSFADDSGRGRGALAAITGALFPYDADAIKRVDSWFCELERMGMARRYKGEDGSTYYDIPNWLKHQKIERPSRSRFPQFTEPSPNTHRGLTDISPLDQGTGNRDQGTGEQVPGNGGDCKGSEDPDRKSGGRKLFVPPTIEEVTTYCKDHAPRVDPERWWNYYSANGWRVGKNKMVSWHAAIATWERGERERRPTTTCTPAGHAIAVQWFASVFPDTRPTPQDLTGFGATFDRLMTERGQSDADLRGFIAWFAANKERKSMPTIGTPSALWDKWLALVQESERRV